MEDLCKKSLVSVEPYWKDELISVKKNGEISGALKIYSQGNDYSGEGENDVP
jgi:hypothetical protein